ncbi:hypothetical protein, partial [Mycolicibacterium fortuitum]|uniref:hypothetical protein n=1 Tax=Mycolicibacterium fortuitum TaxID=1766 RepID=UPI000ABA9BCF
GQPARLVEHRLLGDRQAGCIGGHVDPITSVRVYTDRGLLSRENYLGCVNGEHDGLKAVEWTGPRTVRVELLRGGTTTITLDDRGRPDQTISC